MNTEANHPVLGKCLNGHYQIVQILSIGTFGWTYIAEDIWLAGNPQCIIKHLQPSGNHLKEWQFSQRLFANEAKILEKVGKHDQIPELIDYFDDRQGFYLVQELIVGEPLMAEIPTGQHFGKPWSEIQCVKLLDEVLGILEFVHRQGVIHGDLKPSNLIRRASDGRLVLIDFGRGYQFSSTRSKLQVIPSKPSIPSSTICPLGYIPPEQLYGRPYPSSDLYALGTIAIQALTGLNPAQLQIDPNSGEISWQQHASVSDGIACLLNHMVRPNFKDRYQSASDVRILLKRLAIRSEEQKMREEELSGRVGNESASNIQPSIQPTDAKSSEHSNSPISSTLEGESASVSEATAQVVAERQREQESSRKIDKWYYARELANACWPKLPPIMTGVGVGLATSNALAISFGAYSLWYSPPSNPGLDLLMRATQDYQSGNFEKAIALAKSIPTDSSVYQESQATLQKWRQEWSTAAAQFKAAEEAFQEGRWRDVLEEAHKTPNIAYWQKKIEPLVVQTLPEIELEAQQLLKQAYQRASLKDFTGAIALIKQIPPETPTGATIQPKLIEYTQKQQVKADSLLQKAYQRAATTDFKGALEYLSQIPEDTLAYQQAQVKMAEYSQKQHFKEEVQRQAMLAANFSEEELKLNKLPQRPKSSKASRNLNPGNHLREASPQRPLATPTRQ